MADAGLTVNAARSDPLDFWRVADALWIVAPAAGERASLQEDGRPDPGSIVDAEPLHVEYESGGWRGIHVLLNSSVAFGPPLRGGCGGGHRVPLFTGPTFAIVRTSGSSMW